MKYRKPVNYYTAHESVGTCVLTIKRQEGAFDYAIFDLDAIDSVRSNGPYHIRSAVIYSVRGYTLQNLLAKVYGLGAIHTHIGCDFRRPTFQKRVITNATSIEDARKRRLELCNSTENHPKTGVFNESVGVELVSILPGGREITIKINSKFAHFVPKYGKFNQYWGLCNRQGVALVSILAKAGVVETRGKRRLTNLYDYTIKNGVFIHSKAYRLVWTECTNSVGEEGHLLTVWLGTTVRQRVFVDDAAYDVICDKEYLPSLKGIELDIMEGAGYEIRNVYVPARLKRYYAKALDKGEAGYKSRARYENSPDMTLMTKAKRVRYKKVIAERIVYVDGNECLDMRSSSMRLHDS